MAVHFQIWGFLSGCLRGTAETMFRRADCLNGIDAWRPLVRQVDHGRGIRLEMLRREVQELHTRPIKSLEAIEEGVAVFENTMTEYARAGGRESTDAELKSDLLRILCWEIREMLLWHSTDVGVSFQRFRDTVVAQTAAVLMNRGSSRAVHAVNDAPEEEESYRDAIFRILDDCGGDQAKIDEQILALQARNGRPGNRQPRPGPRERRPPPAGEARPRHCPNCGEAHAAAKCPHPEVPKELRKC